MPRISGVVAAAWPELPMTSATSRNMSLGAGWQIVSESGSVHDLHNLGDPVMRQRTVRMMSPTEPAIVLGSSQPDGVVDHDLMSRLGLAIARRRSGGAAVLIVPREQLWIEFLIPRGDSLWDDDIVKAADWVGALWAQTLQSIGVVEVSVHRGRLVETLWSRIVCFAGVGPGEVFAGRRKVMGLSQRRSREWTRIQTMVHRVWRPEMLVGSLIMERRQRQECLAEIADVVAPVEIDEATLVGALLANLPE